MTKKQAEDVFSHNESKIMQVQTLEDATRVENQLRHSLPCTVAIVYKDDRNRTIPQNALFWANIQLLADEMGATKEEAHIDFKYWITKVHYKTGKFIPMIKKTGKGNPQEVKSSKLSITEYNLYIDGLLNLLSVMNIAPIDPNGMYHLVNT